MNQSYQIHSIIKNTFLKAHQGRHLYYNNKIQLQNLKNKTMWENITYKIIPRNVN